MNVADLIEQLQGLDPTTIVILSRDAEGNGYSPLSAIVDGYYLPETEWYGEIVDAPDEDTQECIVLYGVN